MEIMVSKPHNVGPGSPQGPNPNQHDKISVPGKGIKMKPMTFLKMHFTGEQAEKLWQVIVQNLGREISKLEAKSRKAIRRMGPDANPDD